MKYVISICVLFCLVSCDKPSQKPSVKAEEAVNGKTAQQWIDIVKTGEDNDRIIALEALGRASDPVSLAFLKETTKDQRVSVYYYAAESLWTRNHDDPDVIPTLRRVIKHPQGWAYRDRLQKLFVKMGSSAKPLAPDIEEVIQNSPNSKVQKWQECLETVNRG